jgi:hypothetical protein
MRTGFLLFACAVAGCSSGSNQTSGAFSLAVQNPSWGWNNMRADPGQLYFQASVTLANHGEQVPLSADFQLFSIETTSKTVIAPNGNSAQLANACNASVSLAAGGDQTCAILWELPSDATPGEVVYRDSLGRSASASVTAPEKPAAPACLAALAAVSKLDSDLTCVSCANGGLGPNSANCPRPQPSCQQSPDCQKGGGDTYCSASCPPTADCDMQATAFYQCLAQQCAQYCS